MAKKTVKKTIKKVSKTSKKTVKRPVRKSSSKVSRKTSSRTSKKTSSKAPKTSKTRSQRCILVCGKDRCVDACTTDSGAVGGECIPCPICGHGHFCENDYTCLSCGATRELVVRPYKGA